jgi:hypothetical protein
VPKITWGKDVRLEEQPCPVCGHRLDAATVLTDPGKVMPVVGDLTVCVGCASILIFADGMRLEKPSAETLREMRRAQPDEFDTLLRVKTAALMAVEQRRRRNFIKN